MEQIARDLETRSERFLVSPHDYSADTPLFVRQGAVLAMWPPGRRATTPENRTKVFTLWTAAKGDAGSGSGTWCKFISNLSFACECHGDLVRVRVIHSHSDEDDGETLCLNIV